MITVAVDILVKPSFITDGGVAELRTPGWGDRVMAETVGLVSADHLTGAFNLLIGFEPEESR
ncbi:hypothetical protein ACIA8R_46215 [Nonomuraea sp. NPDC051191]|uniref:hypothetical protein n=1 Tax=Nonomuraea sp. NPDC051191 TaxID=3364372 RepID=UPI0037900D9D